MFLKETSRRYIIICSTNLKNKEPVFSPDGKTIAFTIYKIATTNLDEPMTTGIDEHPTIHINDSPLIKS
jgi:Tol biopolymer transport system component